MDTKKDTKVKSFSEAVPPTSPPSESCEGSVEKLYISLVKRGRQSDDEPTLASLANGETIEKEEEEDSQDIYKSCNSVISQPKVKRYRKNAIRNRCREFAQDFYEVGFSVGTKVKQDELEYWIVALDLAHDKLTVNQYLHRLVIYGYFNIRQGFYEFISRFPEGYAQTTFDSEVRHRLRVATNKPRRMRRRAY